MSCVKEVLEGIGYSLADIGRSYRTRPLYRESDNDQVLCIWKDSGKWIDFKDNSGGSLEELVQITLKLPSVVEAKKHIRDKGIDLEVFNKKAATIKSPIIFEKEILEKFLPEYGYWNGRGISSETLRVFQGGVDRSWKMKDRYVFPIFDNKDNIIGFSGRDVSGLTLDARPKWKHLGDKKEWVYPMKEHVSHIKSSKQIILVESIGDMLALRECGILNSIVTFGLNISGRIILSMVAINPKEIIIAFNDDSGKNSAGNEAAEQAKKKLENYFDSDQIKIRLPIGGKDFGELLLSDKEKILSWQKQL